MEFTINFNAPSVIGELVYQSDELSFDTLNRNIGSISSIVLDRLQLDVDVDGNICAVWGLCPHSTWKEEVVPLPQYRTGELTFKGKVLPGVSHRANSSKQEWHAIHDKKSGWIALSQESIPVDIEAVEFMQGCLAAIDDKGNLLCIWLKPIFR